MFSTRALQHSSSKLCNPKSKCLRWFSSASSSNGFLTRSATTPSSILVHIQAQKPRTTVPAPRTFSTTPDYKTSAELKRAEEWTSTTKQGFRPWPPGFKVAFHEVKPSTVTISLPSATGEIQATGVVISPDGYIVTSANTFGSLKSSTEIAKAKVKVIVDQHEYDDSSVVFVDYHRQIALVKVKPVNGLLWVPKFTGSQLDPKNPVLYVGSCIPNSNIGEQFMGRKYELSSNDAVHQVHKQQPEMLEFSPVDKQCYFSYHDNVRCYEEFKGNYGGPLVNASGEIVGVLTSTIAESGNDQAVPSHLLFKIFQKFLSGKDKAPYAELIEEPVPEQSLTSSDEDDSDYSDFSDQDDTENDVDDRNNDADDKPTGKDGSEADGKNKASPPKSADEATKDVTDKLASEENTEATVENETPSAEVTEVSTIEDICTSSGEESDEEDPESEVDDMDDTKNDVDGNVTSEDDFIGMIIPGDQDGSGYFSTELKSGLALYLDEIAKLHQMVQSEDHTSDLVETRMDLATMESKMESLMEIMKARYEAQKKADLEYYLQSLDEMATGSNELKKNVYKRFSKVLGQIKSIEQKIRDMRSEALETPEKAK